MQYDENFKFFAKVTLFIHLFYEKLPFKFISKYFLAWEVCR